MRRLGMVAAGLAALWLSAILLLHVGQCQHNGLAFDPEMHGAAGGASFASAVAAVMDHELSSWTGWRPNDVILWGPWIGPDNNSNRQLGVVLAVRETTRVFKDHLTKVSSDEYDPNLVVADTMFRNDARKLWFPSSEGRFSAGVEALRDYVSGLSKDPPRSKLLNRRNIELIRLFQTWTDLLGDAHASLYRPGIGFFRTDDVFYHAQGVAHVMLHVIRAVRFEYRAEIEGRPILATLFDEVAEALDQAAHLKPVIILDGGPESLFANHRRNLDAYVNAARQKMYSIREELEK